MKSLFTPQISLNNKTFKRLFGSYIFIIVLCFLAYSGIVIYETITMKREQAEQLYDMKMQEMVYSFDHQLTKAEAIASGINNSYLVRRFYVSAVQEKSVDAYLLHQFISELQYQKAASESLYIYDVALFFRHYDKAYTGGSVIPLNPVENSSKIWTDSGKTFLQVNTLNDMMFHQNVELLFFKKFLIFHSPFRYHTGPAKGDICVLMDAEGLTSMMNRLAGEEGGWSVFWNGELLLGGGREDGVVFRGDSRIDSGVTYELRVDPKEFRLSGSSIWSVALAVGLAVCICYVILAYVFAYRYYKPFGYIRQLIGGRAQEEKNETENEMSRIVIDVKNLVGERDNYKEQMITISPYAEKGMLHSILSGSLDGEMPEMQQLKEYLSMQLEKMYVLVAAVSLAYTGISVCEKEEIRRMKRILRQKAEEYSDKKIRILCQDQEAFLVYLVVNSDTGEKIEDVLYDYFADVQKAVDRKDYVMTMGVDEVREQVSHLDEACARSRRALRGMLTGGRGGIYFYEEQREDTADYYFPHDGVKSLVKMMKENDRKGLENFLNVLAEKNQKDYDLSLTAIQLLEDELYVTTLKAVHIISTMYTLSIRVEKPALAMTFEELNSYYCQVYQTVCGQVGQKAEESSEIGQTEQEIFRYVDEHYTDEDISLTYITEKFHVSNKYVSYIFKKQFGITYLQYVQEKRIAYAVRLLKSTDDTLERIAAACGYSNLLTFRRNFKAIMDVNPSDFQRKQ